MAEAHFDNDPSEPNLIELQEARAVLRNALFIKKRYWKQKARVKQLQDGDKNTKYFHSVIAEQRGKSFIDRIKNANRDWLTDESQIAAGVVHFFEVLFKADPCLGS